MLLLRWMDAKKTNSIAKSRPVGTGPRVDFSSVEVSNKAAIRVNTLSPLLPPRGAGDGETSLPSGRARGWFRLLPAEERPMRVHVAAARLLPADEQPTNTHAP